MTTLQKLTQPTLLIAILATAKLLLQVVFNIEIPDATINNFANGICAIVTMIGIFLDHGKAVTPTATIQENTTSTPPAP